jgi:two-component system, NtrC family, sensor kinase
MRAPLKGETLARWRHDLKTPLNQILGYSAMLLEDAEKGGFGAFSPALAGIQTGGRAILERIHTALSDAGDGVSFDQLGAFESTVRPEVEQLLDTTAALGGRLRELEATDALANAGRITDALRNLLREVQRVPPETESEAPRIADSAGDFSSHPLPPVTEELSGRILVVEDDAANRDLLRQYLEREGHSVQEAGNGIQALQQLAAGAYDLMLLDVIMPEMDGYKVLALLKWNPSLRDLPVIMISGLDETQSVVRCIEMGAEDYLAKPFDPVLLRARIGASLEKKRLRDRERDRMAELEQALRQLKEAQAQLVVQEKMASLGALTAGIAHEIKNPLNFVNNFADVSTDLLEELRQELPAGGGTSVEAIITDLTANLHRIREHGQRADSIVRGMLAHARGGGNREPADVNALVAASVNLAYQGLRAQDAGFHIAIESSYDPGLPMIPAVSGDLSRALLNIANNGCYAAHHKGLQSGKRFQPTLRVRTRDAGGEVEIRIEDNGTGISKETLAKIFNPFFTTKPPGSGMGLGLSISYQIVVDQHKGTIRVETKEGESTAVIIRLPKVGQIPDLPDKTLADVDRNLGRLR